MSHARLVLTQAEAAIADQIRHLAMAYPETVETENFGRPWFRAGKRPFVVIGKDDNNPESRLSIHFSTSRDDQDVLVRSADCFRPTPYMHQHGWTTYDFQGEPDWSIIEDLMESGYRHVALKRMLRQLDNQD